MPPKVAVKCPLCGNIKHTRYPSFNCPCNGGNRHPVKGNTILVYGGNPGDATKTEGFNPGEINIGVPVD